ncbi:MAG: hypothetical protein NTY74_10835 [Ignavibacteriae bacterium]|nr:hypothetical protein [Ignavibacteriota bacterium]
MEYTIATKDSLEELRVAVNELMQEGWKTSGGVSYCSAPPSFSQAMTKGNNMPKIIGDKR